jgi:hypothetical protein
VSGAATSVTVHVRVTTSTEAPLTCAVSVPWATQSGTGTAGQAYVGASGTLLFPAGTASGTTQAIAIALRPEAVAEADETFTIHLSAPSGAALASAAVHTVTIQPTTVGAADVATRAGQPAVFTLTLSLPAPEPLTVHYATADGTALAGTHYTAAAGSVVFPAGSQTQTVSVPTTAVPPGPDRTFTLAVLGGTGLIVATPGVEGRLVHRRRSDFTGNGHADLLWQHDDGQMAVWFMEGLVRQGTAALDPVSVGWTAAGTADFNQDGYQDIFWQHTSGALAIWLLRDTTLIGLVTPSVPAVSDPAWQVRAVADVNGDGAADVIWQHLTDDYVAVWLMSGTTVVDSVLTSPPQVDAGVWMIQATGDLNGDGTEDLVWRDTTAGWVAAWLLAGPTLLDSVSLSPPQIADQAWQIRGAADLDGDGHVDLLWQHTSGWLVAWRMQGTTLVDSVYLTPDAAPGPGWRIVGPR